MANGVFSDGQKSQIKANMPRWVVLQLLEHCNLRCRMCYEWGDKGSYHKRDELAKLDIDVIKEVVAELADTRPHYDLFGGEPLMHPQLEEVLHLIKSHKSDVDIPTNGTLIAEHAKMLVDLEIDRVWISLDGPGEINDYQRGKGVFDKVINGIDKLYEYKKKNGSQFPKIGVATIVTPNNYLHIEEFFTNCIDLKKINNVSIELQTYTTQENYEKYVEVLRNEFDLKEAKIAKGLIRHIDEFSGIDVEKLAEQIKRAKEHCEENGIYVNTYPRMIEKESLVHYFNARWQQMPGSKIQCPFPWIEMEINARGDVTSCHSMYDLVFGNVYKESIVDIWNGERYKKFRKYMKRNMFPICPACCLYYNEKPRGEY